MSLEDLCKHAPAQQKAINRLLVDPENPLRPLPPGLDVWVGFRNAVWGKGEEPWLQRQKIRRDTKDPIENDRILPGTLPPTRSIIITPKTLPGVWDIHSQQILVRDEYHITEQAAISANERHVHVFVVAGQPGIGKSIFLLWLLMRRLARGLPTALQINNDYAILFHEGGVSEFTYLDDPLSYGALQSLSEGDPKQVEVDTGRIGGDPKRKVWALIDTNFHLLEPADIFKCSRSFFVVDVKSSPSRSDPRWLNKVHVNFFYMKPWSLSEILQARPFIGTMDSYTERQLWCLYNEFGANPRDLALYASNPTGYEGLILDKISKIDPRKLRYAIHNPDIEDASHSILIIEPSSTRRGVPEKRIASRRVFELLWEMHLKSRISDMKYYYDLFRTGTTTAADAGWVFEFRMHQLLTRQQTLRLFPITQDLLGPKNSIYKGYPGENPIDLQLTGSDEHPLVEGDHLHTDHYYRPKPTSFPTINSLLLIRPHDSPPTLLAFQITRNIQEIHVDEDGLCRIDNLDLPPHTRKYYVVATPEDVQPEIKVPMACFRIEDGTPQNFPPRKGFSLFHYPVRMDALFPR